MTHEEFWELYDSNTLENASFWAKEEENIDPEFAPVKSEITAYTHNGKYYLRICQFNGYYTKFYGGWGNRKSKRVGVRFNSFIKEFDTKQQANAYFKKCAAGYTRYA